MHLSVKTNPPKAEQITDRGILAAALHVDVSFLAHVRAGGHTVAHTVLMLLFPSSLGGRQQ